MEKLPDESEYEQYSEIQTIKYIDEVIERLEKNRNALEIDVVKDLLIRISTAYFIWENYIDKICQVFINKNLFDIFYFYLLYSHRELKIDDEIIDYLYKSLINFSDASVEFARKLYCSEILNFIIDQCLKEENINNYHDKNTKEFLISCVTIISNIARDPGNKIEYKEKELKECLIKFNKLGDEEKLAIRSMLTLSYIITNEEAKLLDEGLNTVKSILKLIKKTSSFKKRRGNYSIPELMLSLFRISVNEEIKEKINQYDGIPLLLDIIHANVENEIELTLGTIYNLCFNKQIRQKLIDEFQIEQVIKPFENHKKLEVKVYHDGIMWEIRDKKEKINNESQRKGKKTNNELKFDIFVSYAHENKLKVMEIFNELKKYNIRIWIDKEQMSGSILEAMARGIENSRLFVIGMSPYYDKKPNCRSEAEYAYQLQKPMIPMILECKFKPEGWLGLLRGSKLYYEFSERRNTEEVIEEFVKTIQKEIEINENVQEPGQHITRISIGEKSSINEVIQNWSAVDVASWLDECQLGHLKKRLNDLNGKLLVVMLDIRSKSPGYFNKTLKKEFGMKFMEVLKFHNALNNLAKV